MLKSPNFCAASTGGIAFCLCLLGAFHLPAATFGHFNYYTNANNGVTIRDYTGPGGELVIPSHINGLSVTRLDIYAFMNAFDLTAVTIPNTVTDIDFGAFYYCFNLGAVTIPDSITNISEQAFAECRSLINVVLGAGLRSIQDAVFFSCSALTTVSIPESVTNIGNSAFALCSLPHVVLPDSVQSLGHTAFGNCGLTNVTIPRNLTNLHPAAFYDCESLQAVTVHPLNPAYTSVDGVLFSKDLSLLAKCPEKKSGSYAISNTVTRIGDYAFALCRGLTNISIPQSVRHIGVWSFSQCDGLSTITIPKSVTQIEDAAFQSCLALRSVFCGGDAPAAAINSFSGVDFYSLPGSSGWDQFSERMSTAVTVWDPRPQTNDVDFGIRDGAFGFNIAGEPDIPVVIEAAADPLISDWTILQSCTLTNGLIYFSDPQWEDFPSRIYRLRSP